MYNRLKFLLNRVRERLWVRPLALCVFSIGAAFLAKAADQLDLADMVPEISPDTIESMLKIIASSMLVIATFAVGSMVASYGSASANATPRAFRLVLADDVSQNALSSFLGAFIFSIVALIALLNGLYGTVGRFALFALTILVFATVILTFVRWVDSIARLGRLGPTIAKVESATADAISQRRREMTLGGVPARPLAAGSRPVHARAVGYVQRVEVRQLQECAEELDIRISVAALPGAFATPDRPLAFVIGNGPGLSDSDCRRLETAFRIGHERTFEEDPRFGLIVLAEIAGRALSPAVNDPGTAIGILGTFARLFVQWNQPVPDEEKRTHDCDRVEIPELRIGDMFDDAFTAIARDGAGSVEVMIRLLKTLRSLAALDDALMSEAARRHARQALDRAENSLKLADDLAIVRDLSRFTSADNETHERSAPNRND